MDLDMNQNPSLLQAFDQLLLLWVGVFPQHRTFARARRLTFGLLVCLREHLTSNAICALGRQFEDWSSDYRVLSRSPWDPHRLFDPVFEGVRSLLKPDNAPVLVALDDTSCKKTGRKIPGVNTVRDPQSPHFRVNLHRALRFVQGSILISPSSHGPARALPVRFEPAPLPDKPKKNRF
jgi:DDE superfamily endonuclease